MIRVSGPRVTWIEQPAYRVKLFQKRPGGRFSVQTFPDRTRPWHVSSYTYYSSGRQPSATDLNACTSEAAVVRLIQRHQDRATR